MDLFSKLKTGLSKTRNQIASIVKTGPVNEELYESLEEALIAADVGLDLSMETVDRLRDEVKQQRVTDMPGVLSLLKELLVSDLKKEKLPEDFPPKPWIVLVVGVNGVGKTTTIGKIAHELRNSGKKVMLGAADTFRAGAIEQLKIWAQRTGCDFVAQHEGADAASVAFDAIEAAKSRDVDVLLLDTAGRLHNKVNLMNELSKIVRVIKANVPHAPNETLLVVDATTGQNALKQAEVFNSIVEITGLIISKLDGTAKGGVALALTNKLRVPVRKIGVGEGIDDLQDFNAHDFVQAMLGDS